MQNKNERTPPLEPKSGTSSINSELHATTKINSSVKPEQYPEEERRMQAISSQEPSEGIRMDKPQDATRLSHSSEEPSEGERRD